MNDTTPPDTNPPEVPIMSCVEAGKTYAPGQSFPSTDGCNTCQCTAGGVITCTARACLVDASLPPNQDSASFPKDSGFPRQDTFPVVDSPGTKDQRSDTLREIDLPSDLPTLNDAGLPKDAPIVCIHNGKTIPASESVFDGCNTCTCLVSGQIACTQKFCPPVDAGGEQCTLPTKLVFGPTGGNSLYEESSTLSPPWSYSHLRTPRRIEPVTLNCAPPLPACVSAGAELVLAIITDLSDPEVEKAFALTTTPIYGRDQRSVDGTVYSIVRGDGKTILVGSPCLSPSLSSCRPIPAGVERLVSDLKVLDKKMLQSAECTAMAGLTAL